MTQVKVDGKRLMELVHEKGLSCKQVSSSLGFATTYISNVKQRNLAAKPFLDGLEANYGIRTEDILLKPDYDAPLDIGDAEPFEPMVTVKIDYDRLEKALYNSISKAMYSFLNEVYARGGFR